MKISSVEQMRQLDKQASTRYGISEYLLMENAGESAAFLLQRTFRARTNRFLIICGVGNNGGDGLVVARKLHSYHFKVSVVIFGDPAKYRGPAGENYQIVKKIGLPLVENPAIKKLRELVATSTILVDAVFGTGLDREVGGIFQKVIHEMNQSKRPVVSLDIPSGIHGNTGQVMGVAVKALLTITFGLPKYGNLIYPGAGYGGQLYVTHISFPPEMYQTREFTVGTNDPVQLPPRPDDAHKGSCGKVLFIAGSANYLGAPYFSASAFMKTGGGLSYLATPEQVAPFIGVEGHEIVFVPLKATSSGSIAGSNYDELIKFSDQVDMVVIGPGLSLNSETQDLVLKLTAAISKPLLIDGDGLTAIARSPQLLKKRKSPTILTPHPGEMVRLIDEDKDIGTMDKIALLRDQTRRLNSIIVLKGAHSLIGYPSGQVWVNLTGNSGMATAGSGDVLTGIIPGLSGIGYSIEYAVRMGVFVHGLAGDTAAEKIGVDGLVARDILANVPNAIQRMRQSFDELRTSYDNKINII